MKAYTKYATHKFSYPDQMQKILVYLKAHGELHIQPVTVEKLYFEFSDDEYSAGWMTVDDELLKEFSDWLNDYEI